MSLTDLIDRKPKPAFVRYERRAEEDKPKSLQYGRYIAKDVDYAIIQSSYSKDTVIYPIKRFMEEMEIKVRNGVIPEEHFNTWKSNYEIWIKRQTTPNSGTPVRGWGLISPAQQEMIINMDILTIEDIIKENVKMTSMPNGKEIRQKAITWLQTLNDRGPLIHKITELTEENDKLKAIIANFEEKFQQKKQEVVNHEYIPQEEPVIEDGIDINDLLSPHPIVPRETNVTPIAKRRGRPPKQKV
jgi:hypothetical protein